MEAWLKIIAGLGMLVLALGYLYRPAWVIQWNAWARRVIFNDTHILHYRRRLGILLFLGAVLFFYSGFGNLAREMAPADQPHHWQIAGAYREFRAKNFKGTVARCRALIKQEPNNLHAWVLMASAHHALGNHKQAHHAWGRVKEIDPDHPIRLREVKDQ